MLADWQLKKCKFFEPFNEEQVNPASYDVTLSPFICRQQTYGHQSQTFDPRDEPHDVMVESQIPQNEYFELKPWGNDSFILGSTEERVRVPPGYVARVEGKSSLGRVGMLVHVTAGFLDPGFHGHVTLEIANVSNRILRLRPGMRIAQIAFDRMDALPHFPYGDEALGSHYQDQGPKPVQSKYQMKEFT